MLCAHPQGFDDGVCHACRQGYGDATFTGGRVLPNTLYREWEQRRQAGHVLAQVHASGQPGDMRDHHSIGFVDHTEKHVVVVGVLRWKDAVGRASPKGLDEQDWQRFVQAMGTPAGREGLFGAREPCPIHYARL